MRRSRTSNPWPSNNPTADTAPASPLRALRHRHARARDCGLHDVGPGVAHDHGLRARTDVAYDEACPTVDELALDRPSTDADGDRTGRLRRPHGLDADVDGHASTLGLGAHPHLGDGR